MLIAFEVKWPNILLLESAVKLFYNVKNTQSNISIDLHHLIKRSN